MSLTFSSLTVLRIPDVSFKLLWFTLEFIFQTEWEDKLKPQSFPLDVLRRKGEDLPEEVDPTKKEVRSTVKNYL